MSSTSSPALSADPSEVRGTGPAVTPPSADVTSRKVPSTRTLSSDPSKLTATCCHCSAVTMLRVVAVRRSVPRATVTVTRPAGSIGDAEPIRTLRRPGEQVTALGRSGRSQASTVKAVAETMAPSVGTTTPGGSRSAEPAASPTGRGWHERPAARLLLAPSTTGAAHCPSESAKVSACTGTRPRLRTSGVDEAVGRARRADELETRPVGRPPDELPARQPANRGRDQRHGHVVVTQSTNEPSEPASARRTGSRPGPRSPSPSLLLDGRVLLRLRW